jgi:uncharacterized protein (DUF1697 family)
MKYVMFLRGINVSGIKVPMPDLVACLEELSLGEVKTYLQTGNATFESSQTGKKLKSVIEEVLTKRFNYNAFAMMFPATALKEIIAGYPFEANQSSHRYAIICASQDVIAELSSYRDQLNTSVEDIAPGNHAVYWRVPKGRTTNTTFSKIIAKPKYKATTTNRNLNTLGKMV